MRQWGLAVAVLLVVTLVGGVALAAAGPERLRQVLSGGGTAGHAGGVSLYGTLGQPVTGRLGSAEGVVVEQGYWFGGGPASYRIYLPVVLRQ